jgi:cation diffusion facilitator family transporter
MTEVNGRMDKAKKKRWIPKSKEGAAKLAMAAVSLLILIKVVASIITGSISIRADAIHSVIDLVGVTIGYIGIRIARRPPDEDHTFGHGKAENIASAVIAGIIFIAAGTIFYEAIRRLITGGAVEMLTTGIYVTVAAIVINGAGSWYILRVARATDSIALKASSRDMLADVWSSCAVLIGLVLVRLTGLTMLDPIVALLVALVITRTAYITMKQSIGGLMDAKLPDEEEIVVKECITKYEKQIVGFHALRTRKAGSQRFINLHLVMPKNASVEDTHHMCDHIEADIAERLRDSSVTIHVEPCFEECEQCYIVTCHLREKKA